MARKTNTTGESDLSQVDYLTRAGVSLALYFERLPLAIQELPFTEHTKIADFPLTCPI